MQHFDKALYTARERDSMQPNERMLNDRQTHVPWTRGTGKEGVALENRLYTVVDLYALNRSVVHACNE